MGDRLDGTILRVPIAGRRVKIFKKRIDDKPYEIQAKANNEEQSDEDHGDAGSEESELQLIVDILLFLLFITSLKLYSSSS